MSEMCPALADSIRTTDLQVGKVTIPDSKLKRRNRYEFQRDYRRRDGNQRPPTRIAKMLQIGSFREGRRNGIHVELATQTDTFVPMHSAESRSGATMLGSHLRCRVIQAVRTVYTVQIDTCPGGGITTFVDSAAESTNIALHTDGHFVNTCLARIAKVSIGRLAMLPPCLHLLAMDCPEMKASLLCRARGHPGRSSVCPLLRAGLSLAFLVNARLDGTMSADGPRSSPGNCRREAPLTRATTSMKPCPRLPLGAKDREELAIKN
jgi:hypothetical protein